MTSNEIEEFKVSSARFANAISEMSNNELRMNMNIIQVKEPITKFEASSQIGHELNKQEVFSLIEKYTDIEKYDHIFILVKLGDRYNYIRDVQWAGYGGSEFRHRGFSVVRLPDGNIQEWWLTSSNLTRHPYVIYIHEFLHGIGTLTGHFNSYMPRIHDFEAYGNRYLNHDYTIDEYNWLRDIIRNNVYHEGSRVGINPLIWKLRPSKYYYLWN